MSKVVEPNPAKAQVELDYAVDKDGDSDLVVEIKTLYKTLALSLTDKLPDSRNRFLALDGLNQSKNWAVEASEIVPGVDPVPPDPEPETKPVPKK